MVTVLKHNDLVGGDDGGDERSGAVVSGNHDLIWSLLKLAVQFSDRGGGFDPVVQSVHCAQVLLQSVENVNLT